MEEIRFRLAGFKKWGENLKSMRNEEKRRRNRRRRHETFNRRRRRRKLVGCGCVFIRVWAPLNRSEVYIYILKSSQFHCWHCDGYATAKKLGFKSCYFVANLLQILGRRNSIVEFATEMRKTRVRSKFLAISRSFLANLRRPCPLQICDDFTLTATRLAIYLQYCCKFARKHFCCKFSSQNVCFLVVVHWGMSITI